MARRAVLAGLVVLGGCGFTPAYGPGGSGGRLHGRVRPQEPVTSDDFAFNARLAERLGPDSTPAFALGYSLTLAVTPQGVGFDDVTTRYALAGTADYHLTDTATGAEVTAGRVNAFSSYTASGTTVATVSAERDARARLAVMLADQVVTRLLATPASSAPGPTAAP